MVMKTLAVGVIAVLLAASVLDKAQGKPGHAKHALAKLERAKHAHSKLDHSKLAQGKAGHQRDSGDAFLLCVREHPGPSCTVGCLFESQDITTNGELNKEVLAMAIHNGAGDIGEDEALKLAESCEVFLTETPGSDICQRGHLIQNYCM